jgi:hypothetical protein
MPTPAFIQNGQATEFFSAGRKTTYNLATPGTSKIRIESWSSDRASSLRDGEVANFTHSEAASGALKGMHACPSVFATERILPMSCTIRVSSNSTGVWKCGGRKGKWHLFHILMWHYPRIHARELLENLRVFVHESNHVAPKRHMKGD